MGALGKTAKYYAENPEARAKKNAYQKRYNKRPGQSAYRAECNKARADLGLKKGDTRDAAHLSNGKIKPKERKLNRGDVNDTQGDKNARGKKIKKNKNK